MKSDYPFLGQGRIMKTQTQIELTDTAARITNIDFTDPESGLTTVDFEWGGPDDRQMGDFELPPMGGYEADDFSLVDFGTDGNAGRSGWCIFQEGINKGWRVGDTIPLIRELRIEELVIDEIGEVHGAKPDRGGGCVDVSFHYEINGEPDGYETDRVNVSHKIIKDDGSYDQNKIYKEVWDSISKGN